ncbi:SitI3 family protein [Micromonospora sp. NPDC000207]|uniref:SitI3 family protein n=1 Tax=Micromonospora sp. NPDC000207 TaxID=3154246 RepID=UPI00331D0D58
MSLGYCLTLAGELPLDEIAAVTALGPAERPTPSSPRLFGVNLQDERGYSISVHSGTHGYYWAEGDHDASWEWKLDTYVNVTFDMRKYGLVDKGIPNMVATVGRVLAGRGEDAALVQDGNYLLLTRTAGVVRRHRQRQWWNHYGLDVPGA